MSILCAPDLDDDSDATEGELECLSKLIHDDSLLWFRDIRDGGAVGRPFGGGPFAVDNALTMRKSFALCALTSNIPFPEWTAIRKELWHKLMPWTEGLSSLFSSVQEELLAQWRALPLDSQLDEIALEAKKSNFKEIVVPEETRLPRRLQRGKECEELAREIKAIRHKRKYGGLTVSEIQDDCSFFKIWKRIEVLSEGDRDTFLHPGTWEPGYTNLLLGKLFADTKRDVSPGTINNWRKDYRSFVKWGQKNPSKTTDDFLLELQDRQRSYRKSLPSK
jgi:hypothetical protein